jgi:hypothetical protein
MFEYRKGHSLSIDVRDLKNIIIIGQTKEKNG